MELTNVSLIDLERPIDETCSKTWYNVEKADTNLPTTNPKLYLNAITKYFFGQDDFTVKAYIVIPRSPDHPCQLQP